MNRTTRVLAVLALAAVAWTSGAAPASASSAQQPLAGSVESQAATTNLTYHPIAPYRIMDTRGCPSDLCRLTSGVPFTFSLLGMGPEPIPSGAAAVTGNLTVVGQTVGGYLYLGPTATSSPPTSTLNFPVGDIRANNVTVALGTGSVAGTLSVTYVGTPGATTEAIFDVTGYFSSGTGATYHPLTPGRILDTRFGIGLSGAVSSKVARTFQVVGRGGVPSGSNTTAVTGNLTVTGQSALGYLYVGPSPLNSPTTSTLNFPLGDDRANGVTVALGSGGTLSVTYVGTAGSTTQVIFDVTGYFTQDLTGSYYNALTPTRLLDTRPGGTGLSGAFTVHNPRAFQVTGRATIPSNSNAVTGNLTVTGQSDKGYLYVGPYPKTYPDSSTLNFPYGDNRANGVDVGLGSGGTLSVTFVAPTSGPIAQAIFDVTGYFTPISTFALSVAQAQADFNYIVANSSPPGAQPNSNNLFSDYIEWHDPADGCFARAYIVLRMMYSELGVPPSALGRVWALDNWNDAWMQAGGLDGWSAPSGFYEVKIEPYSLYASWTFHTAATVKVNVNGTVKSMVIDPMLAPSGPVDVSTWLGLMAHVTSSAETRWGQPNPMQHAGSDYDTYGPPDRPAPASLDLDARQEECRMFNDAVASGLEPRDSTGAEPPKVTCP
jgi:hypothetical protein